MPVTELDYVSVSGRAAELGCSLPEIAVMPDNFAVARSHKELRVRGNSIALRSVLENANFPLGSFCSAVERAASGDENFMHWEAGLFLSASLLAREPYVVPVALSIIKAHLSEFFQSGPEKTIRLSLVVERRDRSCRKLVYEGDIAGLRALAQSVSDVAREALGNTVK